MKLKLSHSAVQKFLTCGQLYKLHYLDKLRGTDQSSSLLWGTAMDAALSEILKTKLVGNKDPIKDPYTCFIDNWNIAEINGVKRDLKFLTELKYSKKDLDPDLFTDVEFELIKEEFGDAGGGTGEEIADDLIQNNIPEGIAYLNRLSMAAKARYILKAFQDEVMPQIKRVLSIQKNVELENPDGDTVIGFIDFIAEFTDGHIYLCDNKTCSSFSYYKADSVRLSEQLAVYGFSEDIPKAAYIAMLKNVSRDKRKKDSVITAKIRIVKDDIDPVFQNKILLKYDIVTNKIKAGTFERNLDSCSNQFGRPCVYWKFCHENGNMEGLIQKEKR